MNIQPKDQTVEKCLKDRTYYIDFYQREYVWEKDTVLTLLNDVFFAFELAYAEHKDKELTQEVLSKYNWYYLNIYITNDIGGKEYVVDGQQRLTTLSLIVLKLLKLINEDKEYFDNLRDTLRSCICGKDKFKGDIFWIDNEKRGKVMKSLLKGTEFTDNFANVTEERIVANYNHISKYIDDKKLSKEKLQVFIMYFLERLVLVELRIKKDDTPMVFEVINDRGVALKPFEILKGKLIGTLDKEDTDKYSLLWENSLSLLRGVEDDFFKDWLKAKYIFKRNSDIEKSINNQYHRYIFENNSIADELQFRKKDENHIKNIKSFIEDDLTYYAKLYAKIRQNENDFLAYNNKINDLFGQYQNIISACKINDEKEQEKIEKIAVEVDKLYVLLNLNNIYDSNQFQSISYELNEKLKDADVDGYSNIFNELIKDNIKKQYGLSSTPDLLDYKRFKNKGYNNLNKTLLRYFFARVEKYLCDRLQIKMENTVHYISTKTGHKTGYHIEHILSHNEENKSYFETEEEFENKRNRLGGLLLLFNKDNISSGNEKYEDKQKTYSNSLIWGKSLTENFYYSTNKRFLEFNKELKSEMGIEFKHFEKFDKETLEYRSKLLYQIVKIIWNIEN